MSGVKGMRWGVRKVRSTTENRGTETGVGTGARAGRGRKARRTDLRTKPRSPSRLSDRDLERYVRRIDMERKYSQSFLKSNLKKAGGELMVSTIVKVGGVIVDKKVVTPLAKALS